MADDARLYPLFLKLRDRQTLVVGAGAVAERKIKTLRQVGARVRVVAKAATPFIRRLAQEGSLDWRERAFEEADLDGVWLVVAATSDAGVQRQVAEAADARRTFVVAVDDPMNASAYGGAVVERAPFTIAISSSGATPALTRLLREILEQLLPGEKWIERAKELRARWRAEGTPSSDRFADLVKAFKQDAAR